jgi:hypothetical protein
VREAPASAARSAVAAALAAAAGRPQHAPISRSLLRCLLGPLLIQQALVLVLVLPSQRRTVVIWQRQPVKAAPSEADP